MGDDSMSNHYATAVVHDGVLYGYHGRQEYSPSLRAVELRTGEIYWSEDQLRWRYPDAGWRPSGDPRRVWRADPGQRVAWPNSRPVFARAQILRGVVRAYPALAEGRLYARNTDTLVAVDLR